MATIKSLIFSALSGEKYLTTKWTSAKTESKEITCQNILDFSLIRESIILLPSFLITQQINKKQIKALREKILQKLFWT